MVSSTSGRRRASRHSIKATPTPIAHVIQFFHRSTKRGGTVRGEYQKMYDEGLQIALKYSVNSANALSAKSLF